MNIKKQIGCLLLVLGWPGVLAAQKVRLVNATDQSWSGGIAGMSGHRYSFTIEFSGKQEGISPDTMWIGNQPTPLSLMDSLQQGNMKAKVSKNKSATTFEIHAETSINENRIVLPPGNENEKNKEQLHPPVPYKGVALLSYLQGGKHHYYPISRILKTYPPIDYP